MLVPIGKFDDHLDLGIDGPGRFDHQVLRGVAHQVQPELGPALVPLAAMSESDLGRDEKKIVLDDLVKMPGGQFGCILDEFAVLGIGVTKGAELAATAVRQRHAAGHFNAAVHKKLFHPLQQIVAGQLPVALHLDIDLVHLQLAADAPPVIAQGSRILEGSNRAHRNVNGDIEVGVVAGEATRGRKCEGAEQSPEQGRKSKSVFHNQNRKQTSRRRSQAAPGSLAQGAPFPPRAKGKLMARSI